MTTDSKIIDCTSFIYKITIGKYFYYGQSTNFPQRVKDHLGALKNKSHCNKKMQNAYNKHNDFKMQIVEILGRGLSQKDLNDAEQKYIDQHWGKKTLLNIVKIAGGAPDPSKPCIITIDGISKEYESALKLLEKYLGKKRVTTYLVIYLRGRKTLACDGWSGN
jgi:group I intron endonuclease